MIEKTRIIENPSSQSELDNAKKIAKNVLKSRSFHQVLSESISQDTENPLAKFGGAPAQSPIRDNASSSADYEKIINVVFKHEGRGFVKEDAGRESSKFGILQGTARQYGYTGDIASMTKEDAERIYKKLWDKSGANTLPYPLSLVHFDTYVNSPAAARRMLQKSQGDVEVYLSLRQERYDRLAELRPERFARYKKGWANRINNLRTLISEDRTNNSIASNPLQINSVASNATPANWDKRLF